MIGQAIGSYRIVAKLGEGGMGAVYLGEHQHIARKAAIKVLLPQFSANQQIVARFFNEARATSLIRHPGIVEVLDCSTLPDGNAYIVMEFLAGESLGSHLRDHRRLAPSRALLLARHIADALAAAHNQRIVHRDLKPDNVFLVAGSEAAPIKILDFGIAKLTHTGGHEGSYKTRTGTLIGTPVYMSPEQCRGTGDIDHRTDIYSLGCILFEMVAGRPPFNHEGFGELIQAHLSAAPPPLRSLDGTVPPAVDTLVARMLAKSVNDRPQTMRDLVAELDATIETARVQAAPEVGAQVEARPVARTRLLPSNQPKVQTTLGSSASEKMDVVGDSVVIPAPRSRRTLAIGGTLAALVAGGVALWVIQRPSPEVPGGTRATFAGNDPNPRREVIPTPTKLDTERDPVKPPEPGEPVKPVKPQEPVKPVKPVKPQEPAARKIKVVIASEPSGADVCLAKDHVLLGKTRFEWSADKGARGAKLLLRKRGYRGQEILVAVDRDAQKQVTLQKLGPDDLDDTDNCERR